MYKVFEELCELNGVTPYRVCKETGLTTATISNWKAGRYTPKQDKLQKIAEYFNVTVDFLMTGETTDNNKGVILNAKDERDIEKRLEAALADLENEQSALMFSGEPLDDKTRELLKASLENSIRIAKINAKKYTNKRYKKSDEQKSD